MNRGPNSRFIYIYIYYSSLNKNGLKKNKTSFQKCCLVVHSDIFCTDASAQCFVARSSNANFQGRQSYLSGNIDMTILTAIQLVLYHTKRNRYRYRFFFIRNFSFRNSAFSFFMSLGFPYILTSHLSRLHTK